MYIQTLRLKVKRIECKVGFCKLETIKQEFHVLSEIVVCTKTVEVCKYSLVMLTFCKLETINTLQSLKYTTKATELCTYGVWSSHSNYFLRVN